jgi:hypothetical protein
LSDAVVLPQDRLLNAAADELRALGWEGDAVPGMIAQYTGESGTWYITAEVYPDQEVIVFYSIAPEQVPKDKIALVGEYLTRVNDGLPRANLEMDYDSGVVRCRSYLDVEETDVDQLDATGQLRPLVRRALRANIATFDLAFPGLVDVVSGRRTPKSADAAIG